MGNHKKLFCLKTIINCPFKDFSCSIEIKKENLDEHLKQDVIKHQLMMLGNMKRDQKLKEEIELIFKEELTKEGNIENFNKNSSPDCSSENKFNLVQDVLKVFDENKKMNLDEIFPF